MKKNEDKLAFYLRDLEKSVHNLTDSLSVENPDDMVQDAIIKRFELAYELALKTIKAYLEYQGIVCTSPRDCFKQAKATRVISNEKGWLSMMETRNILVHTYSAEKSREMIYKIRHEHTKLIQQLYQKLTQ